ncbi:MAG: hypothetical protein RL701_3916, partial [Pseudomonadota bacterium]
MFQEQLEIALSLTIGSDVFTLPGGSVKQFDLEARVWGFQGSVSFCVSSELEADTVYPRFITDDLIRITLALRSCVSDANGVRPDPITFIGYAAVRSFSETVGPGVAGSPVLLRRYTLQFSDAAALFWKQHFPIELHVDKSASAVFDMHACAGVTLAYGDGPFADKLALLCIPDSERASFYDFACWYLARSCAQLEFDAATSSYTLTKRKGNKAKVELEPDDLVRLEVTLPAPRRADVHVLNSYTDATQNQTVAVATATTGVRRDVLHTTPIPKRFDARVARETEPLRAAKEGLEVAFARFPRCAFSIGALLSLGEFYSKQLHAAKSQYRVYSLSIHGQAAAESAAGNAGLEDETGTHSVEFSAKLEHKSDPTMRLPEFALPEYPCVVEAKIVSFGGGDTDRTWFSIEDETTALTSYQLQVPLFNKKIEAPFDAALTSGHFFFPAYKHARVLVALQFDSAEIVRHLDWADNARLPKDTQGNQIAFGYQKDNGTTLRHVYKDNKPEMHLERIFGNDTETFEVSDGLMRWHVEELTTT